MRQLILLLSLVISQLSLGASSSSSESKKTASKVSGLHPWLVDDDNKFWDKQPLELELNKKKAELKRQQLEKQHAQDVFNRRRADAAYATSDDNLDYTSDNDPENECTGSLPASKKSRGASSSSNIPQIQNIYKNEP